MKSPFRANLIKVWSILFVLCGSQNISNAEEGKQCRRLCSRRNDNPSPCGIKNGSREYYESLCELCCDDAQPCVYTPEEKEELIANYPWVKQRLEYQEKHGNETCNVILHQMQDHARRE